MNVALPSRSVAQPALHRADSCPFCGGQLVTRSWGGPRQGGARLFLYCVADQAAWEIEPNATAAAVPFSATRKMPAPWPGVVNLV